MGTQNYETKNCQTDLFILPIYSYFQECLSLFRENGMSVKTTGHKINMIHS